jgi:hypothetical protein
MNILKNTKTNKMKTQKIQENEYTPIRPNVMACVRWWRNQSLKEDKGGSFNIALYLDYLNEQDFNNNKTFNDEKI